MQGAPKYDKIVLNLIGRRGGGSTTFENSGMVLTSDKLIVIEDTTDSITNITKTEGQIFELSDIKSYETHKSNN